jgi:hypothetical protein
MNTGGRLLSTDLEADLVEQHLVRQGHGCLQPVSARLQAFSNGLRFPTGGWVGSRVRLAEQTIKPCLVRGLAVAAAGGLV